MVVGAERWGAVALLRCPCGRKEGRGKAEAMKGKSEGRRGKLSRRCGSVCGSQRISPNMFTRSKLVKSSDEEPLSF